MSSVRHETLCSPARETHTPALLSIVLLISRQDGVHGDILRSRRRRQGASRLRLGEACRLSQGTARRGRGHVRLVRVRRNWDLTQLQ